MARARGFEPLTNRLTAERSTAELRPKILLSVVHLDALRGCIKILNYCSIRMRINQPLISVVFTQKMIHYIKERI